MLNIKKHSIFSREEKRDCQEYQDKGGVLAVWGSPGSGKTTVAVKLAKYLADRKRNVSLLLCDMTAPMLPLCSGGRLRQPGNLLRHRSSYWNVCILRKKPQMRRQGKHKHRTAKIQKGKR